MNFEQIYNDLGWRAHELMEEWNFWHPGQLMTYDTKQHEVLIAFLRKRAEEIRSVFDANGEFAVLDSIFNKEDPEGPHMEGASPERIAYSTRMRDLHELIFMNGELRRSTEILLPHIIRENQWAWDCEAVRCHYAQEHGKQTHGSYPAVYMWR